MTPKTPFDLELVQHSGAVLTDQSHRISGFVAFQGKIAMDALAVDVYLVKVKIRKYDGAGFIVTGLAIAPVNNRAIAGNALPNTVLVSVP